MRLIITQTQIVVCLAKVIPLLVICLLLTSCGTTLQTANLGKEKIELTKSDLSQLNGTYKVVSTNDPLPRLPFLLAYSTCCIQNDSISRLNDRVMLDVLNDRKIKVTIIDDNRIVKERIMKGKIKDGYFESNATYISPFWVLINAHTRQKIRIGLLPNGNMVIDAARETWGFLVIMPFTGHRENSSNLEFVRKSENE